MKIVDPTYANVVDVPIPLKEEERVDQSVQKVSASFMPLIHKNCWTSNIKYVDYFFLWLVSQVHFFEAPYAKIPTKTVQVEERNVYCGTYFTTVLLKKSVW